MLATQNPIDQEGTYPLPEAQLDRFFFKLIVGYPSGEELTEVLTRTTESAKAEMARVLAKEQIIELQQLVRRRAGGVACQGLRGAAGAGDASQDGNGRAHQPTSICGFGSSPRGGQTLHAGRPRCGRWRRAGSTSVSRTSRRWRRRRCGIG